MGKIILVLGGARSGKSSNGHDLTGRIFLSVSPRRANMGKYPIERESAKTLIPGAHDE